MIAWWKRARQTRTDVHSQQAAAESRRRGTALAYRTLACAQLTAQLMLWVSLYAYDRALQTVWQAAALQALPLYALYALWRRGAPAAGTRAGAWWCLLLLPCLALDGMALLCALSAHMSELIPAASPVSCTLSAGGAALVTVLLARRNGVAYGAYALRWLLAALLLLATVLVNARADTVRLWPFWGQGPGVTALTALGGVGGAWGVALLFALPGASAGQERGRSWLWPLAPWAALMLWALWHALVWPWQPGDALTVGERLTGLARHSSSIAFLELTGVFWLLLLIVALFGVLDAGEKILCRALPRTPRPVAVLAMLAPALAAALAWPSGLADAAAALLPYRAALSLSAGIGLAVMRARMPGGGEGA